MSLESKKRGIRKTVLPFAGASSTLSISLKESHKRKTVENHKVNFDISPSCKHPRKDQDMFMKFEDKDQHERCNTSCDSWGGLANIILGDKPSNLSRLIDKVQHFKT